MAYRQISDILAQTREFHERIRGELDRNISIAEDVRTRKILQVVRGEQDAMVDVLNDYRENGDPLILETWIQYIPDEETQEILSESSFTAGMAPDDIIALKVRIDESLSEMYRRVGEQSSAPRVEEFFERLATQIDQRLKDLSWHVRESGSAPAESGEPKTRTGN